MSVPDTNVRDDAALYADIVATMTDAAISGLCRDGQIELGLGRVRAARPDWPEREALAFVMDAIAEV